jgi:peroxiredoxin
MAQAAQPRTAQQAYQELVTWFHNPANERYADTVKTYDSMLKQPNLKIGDPVPDVILTRWTSKKDAREGFSTRKELSQGKVAAVFFTHPWSPTCSKKHIPEFVKAEPEFKQKDIRVYFVVPGTLDSGFEWVQKSGGDTDRLIADHYPNQGFIYQMKMGRLSDPLRGFGCWASERGFALYEDGKLAAEPSIEADIAECTLLSNAEGVLAAADRVFGKKAAQAAPAQ